MIREDFVEQNAPATRRLKRSAKKRIRPKGRREYSFVLPIQLVDLLLQRFNLWRPAQAIRILICAAVGRQDLLSDDTVESVMNAKKRAEIALEQLKDGQKSAWTDFRTACYDLCKQGCYEDSRDYTETARRMMQTFVIPEKAHSVACWEWIRQLEKYQSEAKRTFEEYSKLGFLIPGPPPGVGSYLIVKRDEQFYSEIKHPKDPLLEDSQILYHFLVPTVSEYLKENQ